VKRLLMLAVVSLAAVPLFALSASAQSSGPSITTSRGYAQITASTTPKRDRTRPYKFTTTGKIIPPATFCAPGQNPTKAVNCLPIICPPGATNPAYCVRPPLSLICTGTVTVRFQKGDTTASSRNVKVKPDCTYSSKVTFSNRSARGRYKVRARFQGNLFLLPATSSTQTVRAG
jgi:hypothetical protein